MNHWSSGIARTYIICIPWIIHYYTKEPSNGLRKVLKELEETTDNSKDHLCEVGGLMGVFQGCWHTPKATTARACKETAISPPVPWRSWKPVQWETRRSKSLEHLRIQRRSAKLCKKPKDCWKWWNQSITSNHFWSRTFASAAWKSSSKDCCALATFGGFKSSSIFDS